MSFFELKDVEFSYEGSEVKNQYRFNLQISAGEILTIFGKSGAGKSTLLDLIAGFLKPTCGQIILQGNDITGLHPAQRGVSILFQKNNLFEHLSVLQNTCLGLNAKSAPSSAQQFQASQMLESLGLHGLENRPAHSLSGGQMQRVALARELLRDAKLIMLDEPFAGLDEASKSEIIPVLKQIVKSSDRAIALVTHDRQDQKKLDARAIYIRDHQIFNGP